MAEEHTKTRIIHWRGVLGEADRIARRVVAGLLITAGISLTFTQLGFVGIGFNGEFDAYALVILLPVALGALLLGTLPGTAIGLITGVALYCHSKLLPLDFYELTFINLITSIVMLTVAGFLLGILFAFALRKNPEGLRRYIYIAIVCIVVSYLFSFGFQLNVIFSMVVDLAQQAAVTGDEAELTADAQLNAATIAYRLGSSDLQALIDAILMIIACSLGDCFARRALATKGSLGTRPLFAYWLSAVVAFAFMISAMVGFIAITHMALDEARNDLDSEVIYLKNQLESSDARTDSLLDLLESLGIEDSAQLSEDAFEDALAAISIDELLSGYSVEEDGLVIITWYDDVIELSDDKSFESTHMLDEYFDKEELEAINASIETGEMQRVVHDYVNLNAFIEGSESFDDTPTRSELMYLRAYDTGSSYIIIVAKPSKMVFANRSSSMAWMSLSAFVLLLAVFAITARLLNTLVARRIDETNQVLQRITDGDLDARVEAGGTREFESLSEGINTTVDAMKSLIAEAETRMDEELATAKAIQEAALPRIFPPFPDILRFDIYAMMHAAREVGGDFYDFFLIGDNSNPDAGKLGFVIADVSGKGVPAALFMMKAKTQIRDYMTSGMEIGEAFENVNRQLCDGNDAGMFVTAWAGELDYATGHVDFVNAGHNPPLLWQHNGHWRWIKEKSGLPLGLFDGVSYKAHSVDCRIGDQFLLYTDGVTEAMNIAEELYGEEKLKAVADEYFTLHPRALVREVRNSVAEYAMEAEQSDDITILALEVGVPPETTATLVVPADVSELPNVNSFIHDELDRRLCPLRAQNQLDIAVEELFVNVAHYAYPNATPNEPGMARVSYTYSAEPPSITVDIADDGIPYDPLAKPDAVTPDDIMEVPIGGLGILMAKRSVDEMRYARIDGSNIVTIVKKW